VVVTDRPGLCRAKRNNSAKPAPLPEPRGDHNYRAPLHHLRFAESGEVADQDRSRVRVESDRHWASWGWRRPGGPAAERGAAKSAAWILDQASRRAVQDQDSITWGESWRRPLDDGHEVPVGSFDYVLHA